MASNQEWSTFDYSHEQEHATQPQKENSEEDEDLVLPELKKEASKRPSESWPLSSSAVPPPDYSGPGSYELRHLSAPYTPNPDMEKGLPIAPQDVSQAGPSRLSNSNPAEVPPVEVSKPKRNKWKVPCLIATILIFITVGTLGISAIVAWSVDHNETTAQIDSTPDSIASTTSEVSTVFSTVPSLTTLSSIFAWVTTKKEVSTSISTSVSTQVSLSTKSTTLTQTTLQTLTSVSTSVQPTTVIETTTETPSTASVTSIQPLVTTQPTTIVTTQVVSVTETPVAFLAPDALVTGNRPSSIPSFSSKSSVHAA